MKGCLGQYNFEKGLPVSIAQGSGTFNLSAVYSLDTGFKHSEHGAAESERKAKNGNPQSCNMYSGKYNIVENHQQYHHRRPLNNTHNSPGYDVGDPTAFAAQKVYTKTEERTEKNGKGSNEQCLSNAADVHFPAVFLNKGFDEAVCG